MFEKVCFIGLGLIGASLAQAMRDKKLAKSIVAVSRSQSTIDKGINYGLLDAGFDNAALAVQGADLVVIATPVQAVKKIFEQKDYGLEKMITHRVKFDDCLEFFEHNDKYRNEKIKVMIDFD